MTLENKVSGKHDSSFMKAKVLSLFALLGLLATSIAHSKPQEDQVEIPENFTITWVYADSAPFHIEQPQFEGELGICDGVMQEVIKATPFIQHKQQLLPHTRLRQLMDSGAPVCFPCMIHRDTPTTRARYSIPNVVYPPFKVIVHEDKKEELIKQFGDPVDIEQLFNSPDWVFVRQVARKFGTPLQPILERSHAWENSSIVYTAIEANLSVMRMLSRDRGGYGIEYPSNLVYYQQQGIENLVSIDIGLIKDSFKKGAIGCSATGGEFTNNALGIINRALADNVLQSPSYLKHIDYWFKDSIPNYQELYQTEIVNPSQQKQSGSLKE